MSEWVQPGPAPASVPVDDREPRAREVIEASHGRVPGYDPTLRWEQAGPPESPPPTLVKAEMPRSARGPRLDLEAWRRLDLTHTHYHITPDVESWLLENSPQWFLRDLERPQDQSPSMYEIRDEDRVSGVWEAALREAEKARILPVRPRITTAIEMILEDQQRRLRFRAEPWQPLFPDDAPRRVVNLYGPSE